MHTVELFQHRDLILRLFLYKEIVKRSTFFALLQNPKRPRSGTKELLWQLCTANEGPVRIHLNFPRNETVISKTELKFLFPSYYTHTSVRDFLNFQDHSAHSAAGKYVDRSCDYINRSQTHECGNWDWGPPVPVKGICKWDFPCSVAGKSLLQLQTKRIFLSMSCRVKSIL